MLEKPTISCIVPVFNGEKFLAEALDSIFAQSCRPTEVIVVDDGSTDGTAQVVSDYGEAIHYMKQENRGPAAARNRGIERSRGEFVAFLDADDLWHVDKLARQMQRFEAKPSLQLCSTGVKNFCEPELKHIEQKFRDHRFMQPHPGFTTQAVLARRGVFELVGGFDELLRIGEDLDWFRRAKDHGLELDFIDEVLVYRRWHRNNLTHGFYTDGKADLLQVIINKIKHDRQRQ